ncbi:MAG: hypothetical protein BWY06_02759 [Candidatus Latescibacteria bacterium ADurb.Bin168]|nr:MAG: hypothetical protein BWY06_02759 [Candidatus Latescibacteria bacterium ADurb.Bin168]
MAEIRERDDPLFAHPDHLLQHGERPVERLHRFFQHHEVETLVGEHPETVIKVGLEDGNTVGNAFQHFCAIDLHSLSTNSFCLNETGKESSRPAAEVEHGSAVGDVLFNEAVVVPLFTFFFRRLAGYAPKGFFLRFEYVDKAREFFVYRLAFGGMSQQKRNEAVFPLVRRSTHRFGSLARKSASSLPTISVSTRNASCP